MLPGGNPGGYFINGPIKGMSGFLLERLGIGEAELSAVVAQAPDEAAVVEWIRAHSDPSTYAKISDTIRAIKPKHAEDPIVFAELYAQTLRAHPGLERIIDIVEADDRRMFPATR